MRLYSENAHSLKILEERTMIRDKLRKQVGCESNLLSSIIVEGKMPCEGSHDLIVDTQLGYRKRLWREAHYCPIRLRAKAEDLPSDDLIFSYLVARTEEIIFFIPRRTFTSVRR